MSLICHNLQRKFHNYVLVNLTYWRKPGLPAQVIGRTICMQFEGSLAANCDVMVDKVRVLFISPLLTLPQGSKYTIGVVRDPCFLYEYRRYWLL